MKEREVKSFKTDTQKKKEVECITVISKPKKKIGIHLIGGWLASLKKKNDS